MRVDRGLPRRVLVLAEAAFLLALMQVAVQVLPFRWLAPTTARPGSLVLKAGRLDARSAAVSKAIAGAAGRLPWHSACLVRALAGRLMLLRRGVSSILCLGVAKDADAIHAHAWLVADGGVVCGGREAPAFTRIAALSSEQPP